MGKVLGRKSSRTLGKENAKILGYTRDVTARSSINLLPQDQSAQSFPAKVLRWALTYGRHVVVLTESVVILAFLMRFSLDQRLSDLFETIKVKQAYVQANTDFEQNFRRVQRRLALLRQATSSQLGAAGIIEGLSRVVPEGVRFTTFRFTDGTFGIDGVADTEAALAKFILGLNGAVGVDNLNLDSVSVSDEEEGIKFTVKGEYLVKKMQ